MEDDAAEGGKWKGGGKVLGVGGEWMRGVDVDGPFACKIDEPARCCSAALLPSMLFLPPPLCARVRVVGILSEPAGDNGLGGRGS